MNMVSIGKFQVLEFVGPAEGVSDRQDLSVISKFHCREHPDPWRLRRRYLF